jgi:hypothetical protein
MLRGRLRVRSAADSHPLLIGAVHWDPSVTKAIAEVVGRLRVSRHSNPPFTTIVQERFPIYLNNN